jgi:hypothetical protein
MVYGNGKRKNPRRRIFGFPRRKRLQLKTNKRTDKGANWGRKEDFKEKVEIDCLQSASVPESRR